MSRKLVVSVRFLASDYVPPICIFTGDTEHISHDPLRLTAGRPGYAPEATRGRPAYEIWLPVPWTAAGRMWWTVDRLNRTVGTVLAAAAVPLWLWLFSQELWWVRPSLSPLALSALLVGLGAMAITWLALRSQLVSLKLRKGAQEIEIYFPRRLAQVQAAYEAAYRRYLEDGAPAPDEREPDEGWPEGVQPGWDESDHFKVAS